MAIKKTKKRKKAAKYYIFFNDIIQNQNWCQIVVQKAKFRLTFLKGKKRKKERETEKKTDAFGIKCATANVEVAVAGTEAPFK